MDISVNKAAKAFLRSKFEQWYSDKATKQLEGHDINDLEATELQPIDLGLPVLKGIGAQWLVDMAHYISNNFQVIVNRFVWSGIVEALDKPENGDQQETIEQERDSGYNSNEDDFKFDDCDYEFEL